MRAKCYNSAHRQLKGGTRGSLLCQMQEKGGDERPERGDAQERTQGHERAVPGLRNQPLQDSWLKISIEAVGVLIKLAA